MRRRMFRAQAFQTRALGVLSRASLAEPFSREMPNIELLRLRRRKTEAAGAKGRVRHRSTAVRRLALVGRK